MKPRFRVLPEPVFGLEDLSTGLPDLTSVDYANFYEVKPEGDDFPFEPQAERADSTPNGCSAFSGAPDFDTYTDLNGDEQVRAGVEWTQTYQVQGPGSGGSWDDLALYHILHSGMGSGGEAQPGQANGIDGLTFITDATATADNPDRWRIGDNAALVENREVFPLHVCDKDGATLTFSTGVGFIPALPVTAYIGLTLFEDPTIDELGPSCVWLIDAHGGKYAWAVVGVRSKVTKVTRQPGGRMLLEVRHTGAFVIPRHGEADPKCSNHSCASGGVAHLKGVKPAFSIDYCGVGGNFGDAPHTSSRMLDMHLTAFEAEISIEAEPFKAWTRQGLDTMAIDFDSSGEGTINVSFASPFIRIDQFDLDPGRHARRQFSMPTKPVGPGTGVLLWCGAVMVDSYPHAAKFGAKRYEHPLSFKLAPYCGDVVDGTEAPSANRALALVLIR